MRAFFAWLCPLTANILPFQFQTKRTSAAIPPSTSPCTTYCCANTQPNRTPAAILQPTNYGTHSSDTSSFHSTAAPNIRISIHANVAGPCSSKLLACIHADPLIHTIADATSTFQSLYAGFTSFPSTTDPTSCSSSVAITSTYTIVCPPSIYTSLPTIWCIIYGRGNTGSYTPAAASTSAHIGIA